MNDITKPLHIYFWHKMTGNQRFIYCRISLRGAIATDFSTRVAHHPSWRQQSQLFDDQKQAPENQHLADIKEDIRILHRELFRNRAGRASDLRQQLHFQQIGQGCQ
jgi:hypothetical protein